MLKNKKKIIILLIFVIIVIIFVTNIININYESLKVEIRKKMYGEPINRETGVINNQFFGINSEGEDAQKTTEGINEAIKYANQNNISYIKFEKGEYSIDGQSYEENKNESETKKGIILQSNITIDLNKSTFKQIPNNKVNYAVFSVTEVENVKIVNGKVIGDKDEHDYSKNSTHEWGFGIDIRGSKNVELSNIEIQDCTGDGVFLTNCGDYSNVAENIKLNNLNIHDNRRQGISIIAAKNVHIKNNEIYNISGTAPQSGIDLESWDSNQIIDNIYIQNNKIYNTKNNYSIIVMGNSRNVSIESNQINGGISCDNIKEKITIKDNDVENGTVILGVTEDGLKQGKIIKKAIVKENNLNNSNLYFLNVESVLVEKNTFINKGIMCFDSNACFCNNVIVNENDNYIQTAIYSRITNKINLRQVHLYLYENRYIGNITKGEDIEENEMIVVHRSEEEVLQFKNEFE